MVEQKRRWELRGLEKAVEVILSWRFPFELKELKTIPEKQPKSLDAYVLLRMAEAIQMRLPESQLMKQRRCLPDTGRHVVEIGMRIGPREHTFYWGAVSGGKELLEALMGQGFKPSAVFWEKGISQNHRSKGKKIEDFKLSIVLAKKVKKTKVIDIPHALIEQLQNWLWSCHIWDNTMTKHKNVTVNFVHPIGKWDGPIYVIVPAQPPKPS